MKAHAGHEGNEKVDQMVKASAKCGKHCPSNQLPKSFIKTALRNDLLQEWHNLSNQGDAGHQACDLPSRFRTWTLTSLSPLVRLHQ
ncbi:hypothetical protein AVEN_44222-1 [Araneus ventricosus]|uniref:RNase H type-1 domain-containing protein n=1 Tax=Araneus ventricosus TaxID=182803 RepID=A0A4Y2XCZ7_ARAVE|nr:hypothetical protein AVEN_44222-1 [Araneus ventricosus]